MHKKIITRKKTSSNASRRKVERISHPVAKKLRLLRPVHTGRLVHRQHTSYGILFIFLVITGFLVFIGYDISSADAGGNITVGLTVSDDPPSRGAVITTPTSGSEFTTPIIDVVGTCSPTTAVVVYSNNVLAGSVLCTPSGAFKLKIQLFGGVNKITALNYDSLNQSGPVTPSVMVNYKAPVSSSSGLPVQPIMIYSKSCDNYANGQIAPTADTVRVAIVCWQRSVNANNDTTIGVMVWGGHAPYALTIDWGDGSPSVLKSIEQPGYSTFTKKYKSKGRYIVTLRASDGKESQAYMQTMLDVADTTNSNDFIGYVGNSINTSWFDSPVPTYFLAVALVIGFWGGDYFERLILSTRQKTRGSHKRHA